MLNTVRDVVLPASSGLSQWAGDRLGALHSVDPKPWVMATGDGSGFTAEFACLNDTPAAFRSAFPHLDPGSLGTSLWQVFVDQPHPQLGSGALLTLKLPRAVDEHDLARIANALNFAEQANMAAPAVGAWTRDPTGADTLTHVAFLPSLLARPGLLENLAIYEMIRSRFAAEIVYGPLGGPTAS